MHPSQELICFCRPSTLDINLAAHLLLLIRPSFPDPLIQDLVKSEYPSLVDYAERVYTTASSARQTVLRSRTTSQAVLRTFVPQIALTPSNKDEHQKIINNKPEEPRFVQWRWAYFAVVVVSMAYAWRTHGIRLFVVPDEEEIVGEKAAGPSTGPSSSEAAVASAPVS